MASQPSSERPQRKRKPNSRFDIDDAISIPVKSQSKKRKNPASTTSQSTQSTQSTQSST